MASIMARRSHSTTAGPWPTSHSTTTSSWTATTEQAPCGEGVQVGGPRVVGEKVNVAGLLGGNPKLDLGVVRNDEDPALGGCDTAAVVAARQLLKIRRCATHPAGGRTDLAPGRMD